MSQGALLQRRHTCGSLKADMVIKPDKFIDHLSGLRPGLRFSPVNALAFQDGKEVFRHGVVVEVANHGQIQHPLAGLDVGNVRYPLLIGLLCESSPRCCPLSTFYGSVHLHSDPQQETSGRR